jgi:hypothetical protein
LLDCQWELGALPANPLELQRLIGATNAEWRCWSKLVEAKFPIDVDGLRRNPPTEQHRNKSLGIRERNRAGALKANANRWGLKLVSNGIGHGSDSDQTAITGRVSDRSQSIPINKNASQGAVTLEVREEAKSKTSEAGPKKTENRETKNPQADIDRGYQQARQEAARLRAEEYAARNSLKRGAS